MKRGFDKSVARKEETGPTLARAFAGRCCRLASVTQKKVSHLGKDLPTRNDYSVQQLSASGCSSIERPKSHVASVQKLCASEGDVD